MLPNTALFAGDLCLEEEVLFIVSQRAIHWNPRTHSTIDNAGIS